MILSDLRSYLKQQHRVALADLVNHFNMDADALRVEAVRARNPAEDVRDWDVAIDFGTMSLSTIHHNS